MVCFNYISLFCTVIIGAQFAKCAEFVPVYMWGSSKVLEQVPALHKTSEESFKDSLLENLKTDPKIIVFAEQTLSPEDLSQRNRAGESAYPNLLSLRKSTHVTYKPYVQNPIGAIKQLGKPVTELSIGSLLNNPNVPKDNILIIDLNDAKDDEQRFHMLQRHDSTIVSSYKDILDEDDNILIIYTAHHTSWVASEDLVHKKSRNLLADEPDTAPQGTPSLFKTNDVIMHLTDEGSLVIGNDNQTISNNTFTAASVSDADTTNFTLTGGARKIHFNFVIQTDGYWVLKEVKTDDTVLDVKEVYAPLAFSYHCGNFFYSSTSSSLFLPGFQIHPLSPSWNGSRFGDAYDCVGFTTVPIWSGLFVTLILLLIMTFGLTMMMDIKTMDRFDDAKGKTITINAAE